jgi:hypothetical protein
MARFTKIGDWVSELTVCTIVSANYLAFARVLAQSVAEHHPDARVVMLLVDRVDDRFDPGREPFEVLPVEQLPTLVDHLPFLFKYNVLEANTAVKPYLLEHLLRGGSRRVVYLDPDIQLFGPLRMVEEALERFRIVLTPHLTAPIEDDFFPDELAIMRSATGFFPLLRDRPGPTGDGVPSSGSIPIVGHRRRRGALSALRTAAVGPRARRIRIPGLQLWRLR